MTILKSPGNINQKCRKIYNLYIFFPYLYPSTFTFFYSFNSFFSVVLFSPQPCYNFHFIYLLTVNFPYLVSLNLLKFLFCSHCPASNRLAKLRAVLQLCYLPFNQNCCCCCCCCCCGSLFQALR